LRISNVGGESVFVVISGNQKEDWEELFTSNGKRVNQKKRYELEDELNRIMTDPKPELYGYALEFKYQPESKSNKSQSENRKRALK